MDMQPINDSIKTTASMYVKTANEIDQQRYMKNLEERLEHERLHGGVTQALAERERILGIIDEMNLGGQLNGIIEKIKCV
jgi:hypothetical protein